MGSQQWRGDLSRDCLAGPPHGGLDSSIEVSGAGENGQPSQWPAAGSVFLRQQTDIDLLLKKLPKNKPQLRLIKIITQIIQTIATERKEILGIKIQFKGRINKRKRARTITYKKGVISLQSYSSRVEYSYSNAYTKSGSLGIKF